MKKVDVTKNEKQFIDTLISLLYAEPGFSDIDVTDMAKKMKCGVGTVKGIMGSLVKKGLIEEPDSDFAGIIYLANSLYHYHPEWKGETWIENVESVELIVKL